MHTADRAPRSAISRRFLSVHFTSRIAQPFDARCRAVERNPALSYSDERIVRFSTHDSELQTATMQNRAPIARGSCKILRHRACKHIRIENIPQMYPPHTAKIRPRTKQRAQTALLHRSVSWCATRALAPQINRNARPQYSSPSLQRTANYSLMHSRTTSQYSGNFSRSRNFKRFIPARRDLKFRSAAANSKILKFQSPKRSEILKF